MRLLTLVGFALSSLGGPSVCCCAHSAPPKDAAPKPAPTCCSQAAEPEEHTHHDSCPHRDCPCKRSKEAALPAIRGTDVASAAAWAEIAAQDDALALPAVLDVPSNSLGLHLAIGRRSCVPFLSVDDLLHVFHCLRC